MQTLVELLRRAEGARRRRRSAEARSGSTRCSRIRARPPSSRSAVTTSRSCSSADVERAARQPRSRRAQGPRSTTASSCFRAGRGRALRRVVRDPDRACVRGAARRDATLGLRRRRATRRPLRARSMPRPLHDDRLGVRHLRERTAPDAQAEEARRAQGARRPRPAGARERRASREARRHRAEDSSRR